MSRSYLLLAAMALGAAAPTELKAQRSWPIEAQVMATTSSVRRNTLTSSGPVTAQRSAVRGLEAMVHGPSSGIGLYGRMMTGELGGVEGTQLTEGRLMIGDHAFRLEVGYAQRRLLPADSMTQYVRGGFTTTTTMGISGVSVRFRALYSVPFARFSGDAKQHEGWEGETNVSYTWSRIPVFAQVGYRIERLRDVPRDEDMSALVIGLGMWLRP